MQVSSLFSVRDKVAIVTGGSRGLGKTLAVALAGAGAHVAIFARDENDVSDALKQVRDHSTGNAIGISGDISVEADLERLYSDVHSQLGPVDILIANAAQINRPREMTWELSPETWKNNIEVTLTGTFLSCRLAAESMIERRSGKIICIASTSSVIASLGHASYIAAKGGVLQFVRALALEAGPYGVNVNAIGPTFMRTEMSAGSMQDPERYQQIIAQLPLGRPIDPEDVVGACIFLASEASAMITGQMILVDAGQTIH